MSDWKRKLSLYQCPHCGTVYNKGALNITRAKVLKGAGGCLEYAPCPSSTCGKVSCVKRDSLKLVNEPTESSDNQKTKNNPKGGLRK